MDDYPNITAIQLDALKSFAARNGRYWKSALRQKWETGVYDSQDDSASLQQIRNSFGCVWLGKYNRRVESECNAQVTP